MPFEKTRECYENFPTLLAELGFSNVVWMGIRAGDYKKFESFMPVHGIISGYFGTDSAFFREKILYSYEEQARIRRDWNTTDFGQEVFSQLEKLNPRILVVPYCSNQSLEDFVSLSGRDALLAAPKINLKNFFDGKLRVKKILGGKGIVRRVPQETINPEDSGSEDKLEDRIKRVFDTFGAPIVVQLSCGASGSGTYFADSPEFVREIVSSHRQCPVELMKYISGKSLNINAVILDSGIILSQPSVQIIGQKECTPLNFGYCGNDFGSGNLTEETKKEISQTTEKIGAWMRSFGYRGIFGVDYLLSQPEQQLYFTEINPRFQGSTTLLTERQLQNGYLPISFFHLLPFLGCGIPASEVGYYNRMFGEFKASQILLHNLEKGDCLVRKELLSGVYTLDENSLKYVAPANSLQKNLLPGQFVITGDIVTPGTTVLHDADALCRILTPESVLDEKGKLLPKFREIAKRVYENIELEIV